MKKTAVVGIIAAGLAHGIAFAQTSNVHQAIRASESTVQQEISRREAHLAAPIRSERDLYWHLTITSDSPLNRLPAPSRWEFIGSLVFTDKGLASFRYDVLEEKLTPTEVYELLSLFGVQHTAPMIGGQQSDSKSTELIENNTPMIQNGDAERREDHHGYRCVSRATCRKALQHICTSNC